MKKLLIVVFILLSGASFAQEQIPYKIENDTLKVQYQNDNLDINTLSIPMVSNKVIYSKVYEFNDLTADDLFNRTRIALVGYFRSMKDATQMEDSANKIIIAKGWVNWVKDKDATFTKGFKVYFTLKIECRDNRYKITVYDFYSYNSSNTKFGLIEITCDEVECLKQGFKKNGVVRSNMYGLSWLAWDKVANDNILLISEAITKADPNTSDDW